MPLPVAIFIPSSTWCGVGLTVALVGVTVCQDFARWVRPKVGRFSRGRAWMKVPVSLKRLAPVVVISAIVAFSFFVSKSNHFNLNANLLACGYGYGSGTCGWQSLGGGFLSGPDATSQGAGQVAVFAEGLDQALWYRALAGSTWGPWTSLGGIITAEPGVGS